MSENEMRAWVVFSGQSEMPWLRFLKPGFRHCYALLHDGARWISVDPLSHYTEVTVHHHVPGDFDLPGWLAARGLKVVSARRGIVPRRAAPLLPFTCVEAVKRILGIHRWFIVTPWQLYRFLTAQTQRAPRFLFFDPERIEQAFPFYRHARAGGHPEDF